MEIKEKKDCKDIAELWKVLLDENYLVSMLSRSKDKDDMGIPFATMYHAISNRFAAELHATIKSLGNPNDDEPEILEMRFLALIDDLYEKIKGRLLKEVSEDIMGLMEATQATKQ